MSVASLAVVLAVAVSGCATSAIPGATANAPIVESAVPSSVVTLAEAPVRVAPSGKADIRILAQGKHAFVGMLRMDAGGKVPTHQDVSEEYIYVIAGSGELTIDGATTVIGPGSMVFMPAGATVSYANGDAPLVALQIFANPESAKKYGGWVPTP
ncbi:MAG: quercetin dioxygenase-like cupin family protein [Myxococcota bacterium]|jgi:quercetin dioxygenase-like cupin family protein